MIKNKWLVHLSVGFAKLTGLLPGWLFFMPRVKLAPGASRRLPKNCILVSNHTALVDFALYLVLFPLRTIRFPMAEVLFRKSKALSFLLYALGGIRVDRDGKDFGFVSQCLEVLDDRGTVGIFPQGRLPVNGKPFPFTPSTAFIALHTDKPIVPVYTAGGYGLFKRSQVVIGAPVYVAEHFLEMEEKQRLQALTELLEKTVYDLKEEI
jgi:1-acyl-sn-glycerol-3-phosphate acyltransferase